MLFLLCIYPMCRRGTSTRSALGTGGLLAGTQEVQRSAAGRPDQADLLLTLVRELALELHPDRTASTLTLESSLEADAGIDSLARVELVLRMERRFDASLDEQRVLAAETPRDLLQALSGAAAAHRAAPDPERRALTDPAGPVAAAPASAGTLIEVLTWHARAHPRRAHIRLIGEAGSEESLTYGGLLEAAECVAAALRAHDLAPGEAASIMLPTGRHFFVSFYGVLLAGGVPVPIYPPPRMTQIEEHLRRQVGILANAQARVLITVPEAQSLGRLLKSQLPELRHVLSAEGLAEGRERAHLVPGAGDLALLQYTSGSTGNPKGVMLTHANLLANVRAMGAATQADSSDVFVSWLPLYHDMGLIGAWLGSLYHGCPLVAMSPLAFIARPQRWLQALHRHRGTLSAAPNFAYELCASRVDESELEGLDLSAWRIAFNGAEPVSPDTLERFTARFARYGFCREAMTPVYGLAECSVGLAFPPLGRGPRIHRVQRDAFLHHGRAVPAAPGDPQALRFVACGRPLPGHEIRIVDPAGRELGEREEGRLEFCGPSATAGYYRDPGATAQLRRGAWLDSGDYAYLHEGEVYITGRAKDLIIRAGRNIYPYELEEAVGALPGVRKGAVAVFASTDRRNGSERLVVLAETRVRTAAQREALCARIRAVASDLVQVPPDDVVLAPPRTVLRTSSGKIRRAACRELYERGALGRQRAVWMQFLRLGIAGAVPQLRRTRRGLAALLYAGYAWALVGLLAVPGWLAAVALPRLAWRRRALSVWARLLLRLARIGLTVEGREHLPAGLTCVLVANHASYIDAVVVAAALPTTFRFVAKRELADALPGRLLVRRLETELVERFEARQGREDAERITEAVHGGESMLFFPEGTFTRAPGLQRFRMGAFVAAARAGVPVVPIALRGTRSVLRGDEWFPRRGSVHITICDAIQPAGNDWQAALRLRDAARTEILRHCGEPDLARE
jgi:1-acyl-sn-glycerol-3-phosphate acyltransferase